MSWNDGKKRGGGALITVSDTGWHRMVKGSVNIVRFFLESIMVVLVFMFP